MKSARGRAEQEPEEPRQNISSVVTELVAGVNRSGKQQLLPEPEPELAGSSDSGTRDISAGQLLDQTDMGGRGSDC